MRVYFVHDAWDDYNSIWDTILYANKEDAESEVDRRIAQWYEDEEAIYQRRLKEWTVKSNANAAVLSAGLPLPFNWVGSRPPTKKNVCDHQITVESIEVKE